MRKVYLDNLPKYQNNRYYKDNTQIDWENSVGNSSRRSKKANK